MTNSPQIVTFGCRLNAYESEVMRDHAAKAGWKNAIIVNTCAVTNEAEREARQTIRRLRRENPDAAILVTGCAVQTNPAEFAAMPEITRIIGNDGKLRAESFARDLTERVLINDIQSVRDAANHLITGFSEQARAFIQVQNGCDHRCTFCIIPFGRGPSRSVPIGEIASQIKTLAQNGYNEVVLTGVDITSYGKDLPGQPTLGQMMRRVLALVPELPRLRLSSIDPAEIDDDIWRLLESEPRFMPHWHLSLQAGDDMILKRMKRRHNRGDVIDVCRRARMLRPDMVFGADVIAGFPTETDDMFENTRQLIIECNIIHLHVFPYSARRGTPAARMPQVRGDIRKSRAARLRQMGNELLARHMDSRIGKVEKILVERGGVGHTEHFIPVALPDNDDHPAMAGQIIERRISGHNGKKMVV